MNPLSLPSRKLIILTTSLPLVACLLIDRISKDYAVATLQFSGPIFQGPLGLLMVKNHGLITGLYSTSPALIREVSLTIAAAFLLFIYLLVQLLLPARSIGFRCGLSILMGGILGNVTERMAYGYVTDFITLGSPAHFSPVFNLADLFQWVGYALIVFSVIKERSSLWRDHEMRGSYWINTQFQFSYCLKFVGIGLGFAVVAGAFTFTYFKIVLGELVFQPPNEVSHILISYFLTFGILTLTFLILLFALGMILSHRIAGPLQAFERFVDQMEKGNSHALKLRAKDELKELEMLSMRLRKLLKS